MCRSSVMIRWTSVFGSPTFSAINLTLKRRSLSRTAFTRATLFSVLEVEGRPARCSSSTLNKGADSTEESPTVYVGSPSTCLDFHFPFLAVVGCAKKNHSHYFWDRLCIQSLASHFMQYVVVHCFIVFPVWLLVICKHNAQRLPFQSSRCHWNSIYKLFSPF
jgi:hypothetical protein